LCRRSVKAYIKDDMTTYAAALAFYTLLALFPFIVFLDALLGFLRIPGFFDWLLSEAQTMLPGQATGQLEQVIEEIRGRSQGGLLSFGIVVAIWSASVGVRALMKALNAAYNAEEARPAWKRYPLSIVFTIGLAAIVITATALMLVGPLVMGWLAGQVGMSETFVTLWAWVRLPIAVLLIMIVVSVAYYAGPNVDQPFRLVTPGAVLAVTVWAIASLGFSFYVPNFANYGATYGSLGAVVVLLLYFFISSAVLLLGAEVNAQIYHPSKGQSTQEKGRT
jgi:membrane protein